MRVLLPDPPPAPFDEYLEARRRMGVDRHDEVWEGVLHLTPMASYAHARLIAQLILILEPPAQAADLSLTVAFNLGDSKENFRVPDAGLHRTTADILWHHTAAMAIEVVSPGDESWEKLPFYAAHQVDELLIIDPRKRSIDWLGLADGGYAPIERSGLIELSAGQLAARIEWPQLSTDLTVPGFRAFSSDAV